MRRIGSRKRHWRTTSSTPIPRGWTTVLNQSRCWRFAVCYVTAHLALDLVDEKQAEAILNYCEEHLEEGS